MHPYYWQIHLRLHTQRLTQRIKYLILCKSLKWVFSIYLTGPKPLWIINSCWTSESQTSLHYTESMSHRADPLFFLLTCLQVHKWRAGLPQGGPGTEVGTRPRHFHTQLKSFLLQQNSPEDTLATLPSFTFIVTGWWHGQRVDVNWWHSSAVLQEN